MRTLLIVFGSCLSIVITIPRTWGQDLLWAKRLGGTGTDSALGVAIGTSGEVYTVGTFRGTADFDPDPGDATFDLTSAGIQDIFISRLDINGVFLWAKQMGGTRSGSAEAVAVDSSGSLYTVGWFIGTVDFDPGPGIFNLTAPDLSQDVFICKLASNGSFLWARQLGGVSVDIAAGVATDATGDVYTTGSFAFTADFDPGTGTFNLTSAGDRDIFISKLDSDGNFLWAIGMGGPFRDGAANVAIGTSGEVYTVGAFIGTVDFDPGPGTFNLGSVGGDAFISKLDSNGNFLWAGQMGGALEDRAASVAVGMSGEVYTVGAFRGTADFDPGPGTINLSSTGGDDAFISKLDSNGNFLWAGQMGGTGTDLPVGVAIGTSGEIYTVGTFSGTADFDPGSGTFNLTSASPSSDVFISNLDIDGNFLWAISMGGTSADIAYGVAVGTGGEVYTVGQFFDAADLDPGPGTFNLLSSGSGDAFISRLNGGAEAAGGLAETLKLEHAVGGDIMLSWGDSCSPTDIDYTIYEGKIGSWYSHRARFCSTGTAITATFTPATDDSYYLVVPRNALRTLIEFKFSTSWPKLVIPITPELVLME